jgi:hypothetical protein
MEFQEFPKISRLTRNIIVTEKIDGTNAQIEIIGANEARERNLHASQIITTNPVTFEVMLAGSRTRYITPGADNFGFARWAFENAHELWKLGSGRHFGEWWGSGIQRGYGLQNGEKRWSLFNVSKWADDAVRPACCSVVPVLGQHTFDTAFIDACLNDLRVNGSKAAPGFMKPEGIVVFHTAGGHLFKKTIERDEEPKSKVA